MSLPKSIDLRHVARLARLHLEEADIRGFESQVSQILSFVEKLNELGDLDGVSPTSHPLALTDVFREDEPKSSLHVEPFLKHAPKVRGRFFEVPKIIEDKS